MAIFLAAKHEETNLAAIESKIMGGRLYEGNCFTFGKPRCFQIEPGLKIFFVLYNISRNKLTANHNSIFSNLLYSNVLIQYRSGPKTQLLYDISSLFMVHVVV